MSEVYINEEGIEFLSNTISQIINYYTKNKKIDCITLRTYTIKNDLSKYSKIPSLNIRLSLIFNETPTKEDFCKLDRIIKIIKEKTHINLNIDFRFSFDYQLNLEDKYNYLACRDLHNSKILYDRIGKFTSLQKELLPYHKELRTMVTSNINLPLTLKRKLDH